MKGTTIYMKKISALLKQKEPAGGKFVFSLLFLTILSLVFQGCTSPVKRDFFNVHWKPAEQAPDSVFVLFTADKRRVVGCCGANRFFGPLEVKDDQKIEVGMLGATRMASPHFRYEQKFLDNLQSAKTYRFEADGTLTLLDVDNKPCMQLKAETPSSKK